MKVDSSSDLARSARNSGPLHALARLGYAVNGLLHLLIAGIAIAVAGSGSGSAAQTSPGPSVNSPPAPAGCSYSGPSLFASPRSACGYC